MNSAYELKTAEFAGPLDKLLELIEAKKLEITRINLAEVTADFVDYLKTVQDIEPRHLADFVSVASKLILIKSHTLLPNLKLSGEEEQEINALQDRLKLYKEFRDAQRNIKNIWAKKVSYGRGFFMNLSAQAGAQTGFFLSQPITSKTLEDIVAALSKELAVIFPKIEEGSIKIINFEEKMRELMERVSKTASSSFKDMVKSKDRTEIVVLFLAILHLLKDSLVKVEQKGEFEDMKIEKF